MLSEKDATAETGIKNYQVPRCAVEVKIEDQREFVRWWRETVRRAGREWPGQIIRASSGQLERDDAETLTGIKHQQVSRWAKGLKDPDAYRKRMYGRAYAAGMGFDRKTAKAWRKQLSHQADNWFVRWCRTEMAGF